MSAENGIPQDKCPKCGMELGCCGSDLFFGRVKQSTACKRIAELQECLKQQNRETMQMCKWWQEATERAVERGNKLRECRLEIAELTERVRGLDKGAT